MRDKVTQDTSEEKFRLSDLCEGSDRDEVALLIIEFDLFRVNSIEHS